MKPYGWFGLLLFIFSQYCLIRRIEPFLTLFYIFAWWSYILLADNLLLKLRGRSLLNDRRRELWIMLPLSVFIWLIFETFNFVIRNWSYNVAPPQAWLRWPGYFVAFSTVLPGIFITSEIVEWLLGWAKRPSASECHMLQGEPETRPSRIFIAIGLTLSILPLFLPKIFFPAVWIGPILLLDPLLEKVGIRSLSLEISSGNRSRLWSLMLGGLACGMIWEFWNFWAGSKWIYSVPYFGEWKIFEMPALGFLGFPPFALECWILYHLLRSIASRMDSMPARIAWWSGLAFVSIIIFRGLDTRTVMRFADLAF